MKTNLREMLLANFADGDTWEEADALSVTKHGALSIAEFFYDVGIRDAKEHSLTKEQMREKFFEQFCDEHGRWKDAVITPHMIADFFLEQ